MVVPEKQTGNKSLKGEVMFEKLLSPVEIGGIELPNRIFMAPLTRNRAGDQDEATDMNAAYYAQRATAGLIVTESMQISNRAQGYAYTPGIYTDVQEAGWKKVVDAVHAAGGHISAQIYHAGRISHSALHGGLPPQAPSALIAENTKCFIRGENGNLNFVPVETPEAVSLEDIQVILEDFRKAAERAIRAGFDLLEVHAANGYLLHQFLATNTNIRTDRYGGSLENRARLILEVFDTFTSVIGEGKTGIRISPNFNINGMADQEWEAMTFYLIEQLNKRNPAYLHIAEPSWVGGEPFTDDFRAKIRNAFKGRIILAGNYTPELGEHVLQAGYADAIAYGRSFIANPDFVARVRQNGPYNELDKKTIYRRGMEHGYLDYPVLTEAQKKPA